MEAGEKLLHTESLGPWSMYFCRVVSPEGNPLGAFVELQLEGERKCRLSLLHAHADQQVVIEELRRRAHTWIDAWQRREHSGNTGFADL